ncbi:transposase [Micromonospora sp. NPDC003241]
MTENLLTLLRIKARVQQGRNPDPSAGVIDSHRVKGAGTVGRDSLGYDARKKVNGGKRFIVIDALGLLVAATVLTARAGPQRHQTALLQAYRITPIRHVSTDQGFTGRLVDWTRDTLKEAPIAQGGQRAHAEGNKQ